MNRPLYLIFMGFMAVAPVLYAQQAINSGAQGTTISTLPLRNLQIEVRQVQRDDPARAAVEVAGSAQLRPEQYSASLGGLTAQDHSRPQATTDRQQVLVLNGQRANIALRNTAPLRLVQTFVHNGIMVVVPGTVLMESGTGFEATPRWDGHNQVELELSAAQGKGAYHAQTASTSTLLMMPLGEWVTVAESAQDSASTEVQVRISVR